MPLSPPRDAEGVIPYDDPEILFDGYVVGRINPIAHVYTDENTGERRISTGAYNRTREPRGGMSIDLGQELEAAGKGLDAMIEPGFGAVRIRVGDIRGLGLWVGSDPIIPENPYHGQVWNYYKKAPRDLHRLDKAWIVQLPGVALR